GWRPFESARKWRICAAWSRMTPKGDSPARPLQSYENPAQVLPGTTDTHFRLCPRGEVPCGGEGHDEENPESAAFGPRGPESGVPPDRGRTSRPAVRAVTAP